jgi:hypothetical protein
MKKLSDADYYAVRLEAEREAIQNATCEKARASHQALADHYLTLLAELVGPAAAMNPQTYRPAPAPAARQGA